MLCDKENLCVHEVNTFQQVNALYDFNLLVNTYFSRRELKIIICMYWELLTRFLECKMNNGYGFYVRRALKRYFSLFSLDMFSISQEKKKISLSHISYLNILSKPFYLHMIPKRKGARAKLIVVPLRIMYCNTRQRDVLFLQEKGIILHCGSESLQKAHRQIV